MTTAPSSPLVWDDGQPRSRLFGDIYFSAEDGLAESRAVFLTGCGLPQAWAGRDRFVAAELGFGTGLNIAALLQLWRATAPPDARLHIFSIEAHPLSADEAGQALSQWPELADAASALLAKWLGRARGLHRVDLPQFGAILDLAVMDVADALAGWNGKADAWFLDGFSPALNPGMWSEAVLALVGQRSAPGARAATFTVAGAVRRGLEAAGFTVEKQPGHGRKRQRLEARLPPEPAPQVQTGPVAIIGAGIAGAAAARALRALGREVLLFEAEAVGSGASGNPAALVTPRLDAGLGPPAELFAQALRRAVALYDEVPQAVISCGALQLAAGERDAHRFAKVVASDLFEAGAVTPLAAEAAAQRLGEPAPQALVLAAARVVATAPILAAWSGEVRHARVAGLAPHDGGWTVLGAGGESLAQVEAVVVATGHRLSELWPEPLLTPIRGQASWTSGVATPSMAAAWGGYVLARPGGAMFGATHDRGETGVEIRQADHLRNRATLAAGLPRLAEALADAPLEGRASIRGSASDNMPVAGPAPGAEPGLFLLTGFGGRGYCLAPLLAEHVAALATGTPSPLPRPLAELVDPSRFRRRAARRRGAV